MPVTIEQVEDLLSRTLLPKPPKHVYVLDGVVDVPADGVAVAIGVARPKEDHVILTPLSRLDTVPHEGLHLRGFGEVAANVLGKLIALKYMLCDLLLIPTFDKDPEKYVGAETESRFGRGCC